MKSFSLLIAIIVCLAIPVLASGTTYYVNNSGSPSCSDTASFGSAAQPWCTIDYGLSHISSGDTLYVRAGTYRPSGGFLGIGPSGTSSAPTKIMAYPGDVVTVIGAGTDSGRVKFSNAHYIVVDGLRVTNFNQGFMLESSDHITLSNCQVYSIGQEGIHIRYNSSFVTVDSCVVHDTGIWAYDGEGIYIGSSTSESTVDNTNNVTVKNSTIYKTTDEGIELKPGTHDCILDGNTLYSANTVDNGYGGAAIEVNEAVAAPQHWDSNPNHLIRNNLIHNTGPGGSNQMLNSGIRLGTGSTAYNNVIYGIQSPGVGILVQNAAGDSYTRKIYQNTIDVTSSRAILASGSVDVKNNIGPSTTNNMATADNFYVNKAAADYHLAASAAPINAGVDLTSIVPTDKDGKSRLLSPPPDLGAYEYAGASQIAPPTNLKGVVR